MGRQQNVSRPATPVLTLGKSTAKHLGKLPQFGALTFDDYSVGRNMPLFAIFRCLILLCSTHVAGGPILSMRRSVGNTVSLIRATTDQV